MSDPIKPGSVVRLKSGSDKMTVTYIDAAHSICSCAWFVKGEVHRGEFYAVALELDDGLSATAWME